MKRLVTLLVPALLLFLAGCMTTREAKIESDYSYQGHFKRYRSYSFMTGDGLSADTSRLGNAIREAIEQRLKAQGYRLTQRRPDLLINFKVFQGTMRFRGYAQEDLTTWVKNNEPEDENLPANQRQGYEPLRLLLEEGTLLVTLVDQRTHRAVWNGYASGVTVPEGLMGEVVLRRSVRSIFDRYRVFTEGFLKGNNTAAEEAPDRMPHSIQH
jgi:hypothetical protein